MKIIDKINSPQDLKKLNIDELTQYADEIREFLIKTISSTGGHLASNLGVVELTLALHYVFDCASDKFIWDVGHQSYVHKIITGRREKFSSLRQFGGISGFPKTSESLADTFNTGHSSTSISAALGMARVRNLNNEKYKIISIIGDGSLTGGMVYEALADAGHGRNGMIVIINDNAMSISKSVGGISKHLSTIRSTGFYNELREKIYNKLSDVPVIHGIVKRSKNILKSILVPNNIFEALGFRYLGPYDGHDLKELIQLFTRVKNIGSNVVIHVKTIKGKGYLYAEQNPCAFHGVSQFNAKNGSRGDKSEDYSSVFGNCLVKLAEKNDKILAVTAAMRDGTGLVDFSRRFPKRFFDVGIAEQHAVTMCCGAAAAGYTPVFAVYSTFLQRSYDQILHDLSLQNLHVVLAVDRAGIVGEDGETHQGVFDLSYLSHIPNMTILSPSCFAELEKMLDFAVNQYNAPIAVRYPRGSETLDIEHKTEITYGKGELLAQGNDVLILAAGDMVANAFKLRLLLAEQNISSALCDMRFVKPVDESIILNNSAGKRLIVTIEDNSVIGGLGDSVMRFAGAAALGIPVKTYGVPDRPIPHGNKNLLFKYCGLTPENIAADILNVLNESAQPLQIKTERRINNGKNET